MGFKLQETRYLKNIDTNATLYIHEKTKAQLMFFKNSDVNKSFSITFKTIPYNHNGIFHILEHSVLCGSEKYPVKEPFVELIKGSFNTFINAMTFPDKTMYPVSSKNDEDLKILMDIYLDAVFNPKLLTNDKILRQEGWHYHLENKDDELIYKGVVYNEMKGVYSSVDEILDMHIEESIFKGTPYSYSSGGKPSVIPTITQKEFVDTHNYCYHPSNSFIFLYGDMDVESYLEQIDSYLNNYEEKNYADYNLVEQTNFTNEVHKASYFNENPEDKNYVAISYLLGKNKDTSLINSIDLIDELLLGNSNTPFRKFFIDSGICEDLYSYVQRDRLEVTYSIVFKNTKDNYVEKIHSLYKEQLEKVITEKFDKEQIQATINKNSFIIKEEVNKTSSPKGVSYAIRTLRNWLYNENPFDIFDYDHIIDVLKENLENNNYENIAREYLLNNKSETVVHLVATAEKEQEESLLEYRNSLSENEIATIISETNELLDWQNSEDSKEDLEKIKSVDAKKVNLKNPYVATKLEEISGTTFGHYDFNTNGIVYSKLLFDISSFNIEQLQYAAVLSHLLFNINTQNKTELEVARDIDFNLGNISANINIFKKDNNDDVLVKFILSAKNLEEKLPELVDIISENTLATDFSNEQTMYNILLELKLSLESRFKNAGHAFVNKRVASYYSLQNKIAEYISGYDFYLFVSNIVDNFEEQKVTLREQLTKVTQAIFNNNNLIANCAGTNDNYVEFKKYISNYVNKLNSNATIVNRVNIPFTKAENNFAEGFYFDTLVQYVGLGFSVEKYSGQILVLRHILNFDYLWNNIRVKGGAYGAGLVLNKFGEVGFWSYRDPNLAKTLDTYYGVADFIRSLDIDETTLNKYIIGTLNAFDQLTSPSEKATISLTQHITNSKPENYDKLVAEIKATTVADLVELAETFDKMTTENYKCIIGSKEIIEEHKDLFKNIIEIT